MAVASAALVRLPMEGPFKVQVLREVALGPNKVSCPPPPLMLPLTPPPAAIVKVSLPVPPTRFSNDEKAVLPIAPLLRPLTVQARPLTPMTVSLVEADPMSLVMPEIRKVPVLAVNPRLTVTGPV